MEETFFVDLEVKNKIGHKYAKELKKIKDGEEKVINLKDKFIIVLGRDKEREETTLRIYTVKNPKYICLVHKNNRVYTIVNDLIGQLAFEWLNKTLKNTEKEDFKGDRLFIKFYNTKLEVFDDGLVIVNRW